MSSFQADHINQLLQSISLLLDVSGVRQGNHVQIVDESEQYLETHKLT